VLSALFGSASSASRVGAETRETSNETIVRSDTGRITVADVQAVAAQQVPTERARLAREGVGELVERMLRYDLLVHEAERRGYTNQRNVIAAAQRKASDLLIASATVVDPKSIPEVEVARAREQRAAEWNRPAMRRASQIVVATRAEAEQLIAQLAHHSREEFARVATERSIDAATRKQGGELGYFAADGAHARSGDVAVPPQLVAAVFAQANVGSIVRTPVALSGGFSVVMLTGLQPAFIMKPAQIDERVREQLAAAQQMAKLGELERGLREEYKPVVHAELIDPIVLPPASQDESAGIPQGFPPFPPDPREPPKLVEPDGI
jgi:parvulin-like peptidyl-prolyl isomerase